MLDDLFHFSLWELLFFPQYRAPEMIFENKLTVSAFSLIMYFQKLQEPSLVEEQNHHIIYTDTEELKGHIQAKKVMLNISLLASALDVQLHD